MKDILLMIDITRQIKQALDDSRDEYTTIAALCDITGYSKSYMERAVSTLAKAGILTTKRGAGGGLRFTKPTDTLRVNHLIKATTRASGRHGKERSTAYKAPRRSEAMARRAQILAQISHAARDMRIIE